MIRRQSRPGRLDPVAQADSLTLQKELVAAQPGLYSILGPYSIAAELRDGRLQASRLVRPDLVRHVTLALPRHGKLSPACRVVAQALRSQVLAWGNQITEP
jgi:DNA-binding transcriptional LysR family regulator